MLLGKFFTLAAITMAALFGGEAEAGHKSRHRGWRKIVHNKCNAKGTVAMALGGEITKKLMTLTHRLLRKGVNLTLVLNGRDLKQPHHTSHRRRNREFLEKVAGTAQIAILPWSTKHSLRRMKRRHVLRLYDKSAHAIQAVIGVRPIVAHVGPSDLKKRVVKNLHRGGYRLIGSTIYEPTEKNLNRDSFIGLQFPHDKGQFTKFVRRVRGALLDVVSLDECLGSKGIYEDPSQSRARRHRKRGHKKSHRRSHKKRSRRHRRR